MRDERGPGRLGGPARAAAAGLTMLLRPRAELRLASRAELKLTARLGQPAVAVMRPGSRPAELAMADVARTETPRG